MFIKPLPPLLVAFLCGSCLAQPTQPATQTKPLQLDAKKRQIRVECETLNVEIPLEFFCVLTGTADHESALRTSVKPSAIHALLLALGLKPGQPLRYSDAAKKWLPPQGPPLHIHVEFEKDGKTVSYPAYRMLRNLKTRKEAPPLTWVFTGSRVMEDNVYAADVTGYIVSVVNFDLTLIDIPDLASSKNETLEWQINTDLMPKAGTKVWMVIEPAGKQEQGAAGPPAEAQPAAATTSAPNAAPISDVTIDQQKVQSLRSRWDKQVAPHHAALRQAAQAHYEVVNALRREQQRLIDEADRVQRVIDQIEKDYRDMTAPRDIP